MGTFGVGPNPYEGADLTQPQENAMIRNDADIEASPVAMAGQRVDAGLRDLDAALERLIHRLDVVLGPDPTATNDVNKVNPHPFGSDLANSIHLLAVKVEEMTDTIHRVTTRLEI